MLYRTLSLIALLVLLIIPASAQTKQNATNRIGKKQLTSYIESLKKDSDLKNALWSVMVADCVTQKTIASYQSSTNLVPASILKLVTTGVGILTFGENYKFTTQLVYDGNITADSVLQGNVYIIGGGDPSFGSTQFSSTSADSIFSYFYKSIKQLGIRSINGKLIADISLFDDVETHDTWEWGDMGNYYGAGASALSFCENTFNITLKTGSTVKEPITIGNPQPSLLDAIIKNKITATPKDSSVNAIIYSSPMIAEYWVGGTVPIGRDSIVAKGAIKSPALICLKNFDAFLNQKGVSTTHQYEIKFDTIYISPINAICKWQSPKYSEIADNTNRYSNNIFADIILKGIAAYNSKLGKASYEMGVAEVMRILKTKMGDVKGIRTFDGSGLSRQNMVSADFMCRYLLMMYKAYPKFDKLIPGAGEKGTLAGFMSADSYKNNRNKVRMKSGSMTGVLNYAGYVKNKKGQTYSVTVMTNNFTCKVSQIRPKLEKLIYLITESE